VFPGGKAMSASAQEALAASRAWAVQVIRGLVLDRMGKKDLRTMALLSKEGSDMALAVMWREVDATKVERALKTTKDAVSSGL
jgi:hypothetical protein